MSRYRFVLYTLPPAGPRLGTLQTIHGAIQTPAYVPSAACGAVGSLRVSDLSALGVQAISVSLYSLLLRPGLDAIISLGGLHAFTAWRGPLLADPGDVEISALGSSTPISRTRRRRGGRGRLLRSDFDGLTFSSYVDGSVARLRPEQSVEAQARLGADLGRSPGVFPVSESARNPRRGRDWAARAGAAARFEEFPLLITLAEGAERQIGGFEGAVGFARHSPAIHEPLAWPEATGLRLVFGERGPVDLLRGLADGADVVTGDSASLAAAEGIAFVPDGPLSLVRPATRADERPLDSACACETCGFASRAYLHHLLAVDEMAGPTLLACHNLAFLLRIERAARGWIAAGLFEAESRSFLADYLATSGEAAW